ncbi:MAG: AraC family transcriptional regulator [Armatimonadia bacterium]
MPTSQAVISQVPLPTVGFAGSLSFTFYWAARQTVPPGWMVEPGRRDHAVLWLIVAGQLHLQTPSGGGDCGPGTLIVFPPGSSPQAENRGAVPATRYVLSFEMRVWGEVDFFRLYRTPAISKVSDLATLIEPWERLVAQLEAHDGAVTLGAEGWARVLVDAWLSALEAEGELLPAVAADERLTAVLAAVDDDLRGDWTLARLSEVMCLSPVRVRQIFTRHLGLPPARYITLRRIAHARDLLAQTDLTSVEIAERCGFPDPSHFSRVFHRLTGVRPTQYREQTRRRD